MGDSDFQKEFRMHTQHHLEANHDAPLVTRPSKTVSNREYSEAHDRANTKLQVLESETVREIHEQQAGELYVLDVCILCTAMVRSFATYRCSFTQPIIGHICI